MAVIVQYIVVRDGVQKMTFTTKKEADTYDKMLDIADNLYELIESSDIDIDETQLEDISFFLATNKEEAVSILRGIKKKEPKPVVKPDITERIENKPTKAKKKATPKKVKSNKKKK